MSKEKVVLEPQKSTFRVRGILGGFSSDKFYSEGVSTKNGKAWKRLNFLVQTTLESKIYVELMGNEMDKAYAYSQSKKQSMPIDWDKRNNTKLPDGFKLIEPDWDKIDRIKKDFDDGKSAVVIGEIQYSEYEEKLQQKFVIKNILPASKEVDFEADDFKEENKFTQELTVTSVNVDKDENKVYLNAYIIQGRGKEKLPDVQSAVFSYDPNRDKAFAKTMIGFKFGDTMRVQGIINSKIIKEEIVQASGWGEVDTVISKTIKDLEITGGFSETFEKKKYREEDFDEVFTAKQALKDIGQEEKNKDEENDTPEWAK